MAARKHVRAPDDRAVPVDGLSAGWGGAVMPETALSCPSFGAAPAACALLYYPHCRLCHSHGAQATANALQ